jgi:hypothetical protein
MEPEQHHHLPDSNRLSVMIAAILLVYAITPWIKLPETELALPVLGVDFSIRLNVATLAAALAVALAAAGADWLLRGHPELEGRKSVQTFQHLLLPSLTAWIIAMTLASIESGMRWWSVFAFGSLLLVLILVGEYIVVDLSDARHALATMGLTGVSYALLLVLIITNRASGLRLYLMFPSLFIPVALVVLRAMYLRLSGRWCYAWSMGIALVVGQLATGLHYTALSPVSFGLLILGLTYGLTSLAGSIEEKRPIRSSWLEPAVMTTILWLLAITG